MPRWIILLAAMAAAMTAQASGAPWEALRAGGHIVMLRHAATEPGLGDPPQFTLGDCSTQRNLSEAGKRQARNIGQRFRQERVRIDAVLSSRWCRCLDTATLAFGNVTPDAALDSFFGERRDNGARQTAEIKVRMRKFRGTGNLVMVTHQVNITAVTGIFPEPGEILVLRWDQGESPRLVGRIPSPD